MNALNFSNGIGETNNGWFVVYCDPSREQIAAALLKASGYDVFLPLYMKTIRRTDRIKRVMVALFSRYLFCRLTSSVTSHVLGTPGVTKLIGFRDGNGVLENKEIELLRKVTETQACLPFKGMAVGTRVRLRGGSLDGIEGILVGQKGQHRLVIHVELIHRSIAIMVDEYDVEPV